MSGVTEPMFRGYLHGAWAKEHFSEIEYYQGLRHLRKKEYLIGWTRGRSTRARIRVRLAKTQGED